jgi:hypothetical protein
VVVAHAALRLVHRGEVALRAVGGPAYWVEE